MIKNKIASFVAGISILAAIAANAANVLPTPGSSAGYLYFPAASSGASGTGGSGGATVTGCYVGMTLPADVSTTPMPCVPGDPVYASGTNNTEIGKYAGYDNVTMKHLIVAATDSAKNEWCDYDGSNKLGTNNFDGASNTTKMAAACASTAAKVCLGLGEKWFLPSYYELATIYTNRAVIGGFAPEYYWASTENPSSNYGAWALNFSNGAGNYQSQSLKYAIRCIRSF